MKANSNQILQPNDHRFLNQQLKMFVFLPKVGSSLPIWLPNGAVFKHLLKSYLYDLETAHDFIYVNSPILAKEELYRISGHLTHYHEYMFPNLEINEQKLRLRPMTCPHHCLIFEYQNYSYHDLPIRMAENALLFRYEKSGAIHGLERVRQMELKDNHIFLPKDFKIIATEIVNCFKMTKKILNKLGLWKQISIDLSLHDFNDSSKYYQDASLWSETETLLAQTLDHLKINYQKIIGEAAFYGPKIDFQFTTHLNHRITVATIQLDFLLAKKFQLKYRTAAQIKGQEFATPIIIHHGTIGTYERLLALLLEHHQGWLPLWITPVQIAVFMINRDENEKISDYTKKITTFLKQHKIRVKIMSITKSLQDNIKQAWNEKIPVHLFIGKNECENNQVTFYFHENRKERQTTDIFQLLHQLKNLTNFT